MRALAFSLTCLLLFGVPCAERADALDSGIYTKLAASRDALLSQQREIQRSVSDLSREIDELKRKQALLDSYQKETEIAIREVERAMHTGQ